MDLNQSLGSAIIRGDIKKVAQLISDGADVNQVDGHHQTPLMKAAQGGHVKILQLLLAAGAIVNLKGGSRTALMEAATGETEMHTECVRALINAGADVNFGEFTTILIVASGRGTPVMVKELLAAGADVNAVKRCGTALTNAVENNRTDNVPVLLQGGANVALRTPPDYNISPEYAGLSAPEIAQKKGLKKIMSLIKEAVSDGGPPMNASKPKAVQPVATSWKRIEKWGTVQSPDVKASLKKGASAKSIRALEVELGRSLPLDFVKSYQIHDGQSLDFGFLPDPDGGDREYFLIPIGRIAKEWNTWRDLIELGEFKDDESLPDPGIVPDWWNRGWIPFALNGIGDSLCIDLAPTAAGTVGQVISMNHESSRRAVLADSFAAWLADLAVTFDENQECE